MEVFQTMMLEITVVAFILLGFALLRLDEATTAELREDRKRAKTVHAQKLRAALEHCQHPARLKAPQDIVNTILRS